MQCDFNVIRYYKHYLFQSGCLCPGVGKLLTGSSVGQLRVWDVKSVFSVQASTRTPCSTQSSGINMDDEMSIDGAIVSACFDDVLEMVVTLIIFSRNFQ